MNSHTPATLSPQARRTQIVALLNRHGSGSIDDLAAHFQVSGMTIRRDLQELADDGRVIRTLGGAAPGARVSFEFRFLKRMENNAAAKQQIAQVAAGLVKPGQSVMLDAGTTTQAIARQLKAVGELTVITTSLPIASELFGCEGIEVLILGGRLRKDSPDLLGAVTDNNLELFSADITFIGADAIDRQGNIYNSSAELGRMLKRMASATTQVYAVADHSKIGHHELMRFAKVSQWAGLITDDKLDGTLLRDLKRAGVTVLQPMPKKMPKNMSKKTPKKTLKKRLRKR